MTPSILRYLLLCLSAAIVAVVSLYFFYKEKRFDGGFIRKYRDDFLGERRLADMGFNSYYIAGAAGGRIYLGNITAPSYLLSYSMDLKDSSLSLLSFPSQGRLAWGRIMLTIDSLNKFAWENVTPAVLQSPRGTTAFVRYHSLQPVRIYSSPVICPPAKVIARTYDATLKKSLIALIDYRNPDTVKHADLLEKQLDGYFCTDGFLIADESREQIAYVYYYRNNFLSFTTNLELRYTARTIDTVRKAHISIETIKSDGHRTFSAPPYKVNKSGFMTRDWIFIESLIKADNDEEYQFASSSVIDVYASQTGKYTFSFRVPNFGKSRVSWFFVRGDKLFVIQDHFLLAYTINAKHLSSSVSARQ